MLQFDISLFQIFTVRGRGPRKLILPAKETDGSSSSNVSNHGSGGSSSRMGQGGYNNTRGRFGDAGSLGSRFEIQSILGSLVHFFRCNNAHINAFLLNNGFHLLVAKMSNV